MPLNKILSGGPPKDGIPSIDKPKFISVEEADKFLDDNDLVLGLNYNNVQKAYPLRILNWHEIVNDFANDEAVLITYCPLCGTGIAFKREINNEEVEFGTSGKLYNSNLVMYDRKTDSYWYQLTGEAIVGELTGMKLEKIAIDTVRWSDWKKQYPNTLALSRDTGFIRNYDVNPYGDYENSKDIFFPVDNDDDRLFAKEFIYGIEINGKTKAYPWSEVKKTIIVNDEFNDKKLLVLSKPEDGAVRIFDRSFNNKVLEFRYEDNKLLDQDNIEWNFNGESSKGKLNEIIGVNSFWFAWVATNTETELFINM